MIGEIVIPVLKGKQLIAKGVLQLPAVQRALRQGKVVLKGGTTVSAVAEQMGFPPLRISGRVAPDGLRASRAVSDDPHTLLIEQGRWGNADHDLVSTLSAMGPSDAFIIGANALDAQGVAGMLTGAELGGNPGMALNACYTEGIPMIIAVGLEKLIPGSIVEISRQAGRKRVDVSMGMAVGMIPLFGTVITEVQALEMLTGVRATVIAAGGVLGGEGATVMLAEGEEAAVKAAIELVERLGDKLSGAKASLESCRQAGSGCGRHLACLYRGSDES